MTTVTVTTQINHKYLMGKTKSELCSMISWILDVAAKREGYAAKLADEAERVLLAAQQDGLPKSELPHLARAIKDMKDALGQESL